MFIREGLRDHAQIVRGDVRDQALLERVLGEQEIDTVIHLAAQTIVGIANRNPVSTLETNIAGTWALLEACRRSPTVHQIVLASSDKAYGDQPHFPYNEPMPLQGRHPYDVSQSCGDLIAQVYARTYDLPLAVTRCGNPDIHNMATHEIRGQYLSATRAREILGWRPAFTLEEGLDRTIAWYREFLGATAA